MFGGMYASTWRSALSEMCGCPLLTLTMAVLSTDWPRLLVSALLLTKRSSCLACSEAGLTGVMICSGGDPCTHTHTCYRMVNTTMLHWVNVCILTDHLVYNVEVFCVLFCCSVTVGKWRWPLVMQFHFMSFYFVRLCLRDILYTIWSLSFCNMRICKYVCMCVSVRVCMLLDHVLSWLLTLQHSLPVSIRVS